uniref:DUF4283 domain-containing protein n=1 Tax=Cannabis sativa TaxID=3483 RepID=A0A803Q042_CANSA
MEVNRSVNKDIHVESDDENMNKILERDNALELEILELFEDISLEDVVANKACVGKVISWKDMPTSVVKKILTGVLRRLGPWRIKKCEDGILGFFFEHEEDCSFVLQKRPWLVNGILLNLKPWPMEGDVHVGEFAVARFWVQIHRLPTRCLTNDNAPIMAKKIGSFVLADDKSKTELVRREIGSLGQKLPCSDGDGHSKGGLDTANVPKWELHRKDHRGTWKRRLVPDSKVSNGETSKDKETAIAMVADKSSTVMSCPSTGSAHNAKATTLYDSGSGNEEDKQCTRTVGEMTDVAKEGGDPEGSMAMKANFLNLLMPDFAKVVDRPELIPDLGPTLAQCLDAPHEWLCLSQKPHLFLEPTPICWRNSDTEAQKLFFQLYGLDFLNLYKAQQKSRGKEKKGSMKRSSGVKTRSGRKKCVINDTKTSESTGNLDEILANCVEVEVVYEKNFMNGEEAAGLIRDSDTDVIFLSETKVDTVFMVSIMNRLGFVNSWCISANGIAGGFCVAWRTGIDCQVLETFEAGFHLTVQLDLGQPSLCLFCVYGWGRKFARKKGALLKFFLFNTGGVDLGCKGGINTWQNSRNACNRICKRLDKAIADANWCTEYPKAQVFNYPIAGSDHAPICLNLRGEVTKLNYPFRFLEVWTSRSDYETVIKNSWMRSITGSSATKLLKKLNCTKYDLKKWNQEVYGFCDKKLMGLLRQLGIIQKEAISQTNVEKEAEIQLEIIEMEGRIDRIWK